jgi:hypothetical protein
MKRGTTVYTSSGSSKASALIVPSKAYELEQ